MQHGKLAQSIATRRLGGGRGEWDGERTPRPPKGEGTISQETDEVSRLLGFSGKGWRGHDFSREQGGGGDEAPESDPSPQSESSSGSGSVSSTSVSSTDEKTAEDEVESMFKESPPLPVKDPYVHGKTQGLTKVILLMQTEYGETGLLKGMDRGANYP